MIEPNQYQAILLAIIVLAAAILGGFEGVDIVRRRRRKKRQNTPLKARKGPLEAFSPQDGTDGQNDVIEPYDAFPECRHMWRLGDQSDIRWSHIRESFYRFRCEKCKVSRYMAKWYFWTGPPKGNSLKPWAASYEYMRMQSKVPINEALKNIPFSDLNSMTKTIRKGFDVPK